MIERDYEGHSLLNKRFSEKKFQNDERKGVFWYIVSKISYSLHAKHEKMKGKKRKERKREI